MTLHSHTNKSDTRQEFFMYGLVLVIGLLEVFLEIVVGFIFYDNTINAAGGVHTGGDLTIVVLSALTVGSISLLVSHSPLSEWYLRTIMGFAAVLIFITGGLGVIAIALERLASPVEGVGWVAAVIGLISIGLNLLKHTLLNKHGGERGNINLKSLTRHVKIDIALGAVAVIGGTARAILASFDAIAWAVLRIDPVLSLIVALWLLYSGYEIAEEILTGQVIEDSHKH